MRDKLHAIAGKQASGENTDGAQPHVVGKQTLAEALGEGHALPDELRKKFARSLDKDVDGVRVHTGPKAAALANAMNARAFTVGKNMIFGANEYKPETKAGRALIAHEVAHAAQQGFAASGAVEVAAKSEHAPIEIVSGPTELAHASAAAEANADGAAGAMIAGLRALVTPQPIAIARKRNDDPIEDSPVDTKASTEGATHDETMGELTAERVGEEQDESMGGPLVEKPDTGAVKSGLAGFGGKLKSDVDGAAGGTVEATPPGGGGGGEGGELGGSVQEAQREAREAASAAESESSAYKAEMKARQDKFDAEQHALTVERLKTMGPKDKRSTLADLGYDPKSIKKLKDGEIDDLILGKLEAENRKGKILGMEPEELAKLSSTDKLKFLCDIGIDRADLERAGPAKYEQLFADVIKASKVPGQQKVKVKVKGGPFGKSWVVTIKVDDAGVDISAKKEGGILSKIAGFVKAALPVVLTVLAPITGGVSLIALSVYQTVHAIKTGDWLGAIVGAAGAFAGLGALKMVKNGVSGLATALKKVGDVAAKVKSAATAAQTAMLAAKAKNPGSLLAALAEGAATFASFASNAAGKFATTMTKWSERLQKWSAVATGGQKVVEGIKHGDPLAAIGGAFDTAGAIAGGKTQKDMKRASAITTYVNTGRRALQANPPDYAAVADAALGIAGQLHHDRKIEDAQRIVTRANALRIAWNNRAADPAALAQAALALAEGIQLAKYDLEHDEKPAGTPDEERDAIVARYQRSSRIVGGAAAAIRAVTTRPPDYTAALAAATQLTAELTADGRIDAAAEVTANMDRWTKAVRSGDQRAIMEAGIAFGESINGMRSSIEAHNKQAKQEAERSLPPGEELPEIETIPAGPNRGDLLANVPGLPPEEPERDPIVIDKPVRLEYSGDVELAQRLLHKLGYPIAIDGFLGEQTRAAVAAFQRSLKPPMRATGDVDRATLDRIIAAATSHDGGTANAAEQDAAKHALMPELRNAQIAASNLMAHVNDTLPAVRSHRGPETARLATELDKQMTQLEFALTDSRYEIATAAQIRKSIDSLRYHTWIVEHGLDQVLKAGEPEVRNRELLAAGAKGLVWAADSTFEALAHRVPAFAAAYGFLREFLPTAIHERDFKKATLQGLGGAAAMFFESRRIDRSKLGDVIAKEAAKSFAQEVPDLIQRLGAIRATSLGDFTRQAEPIVAASCKEIVSDILGEVVTNFMPAFAPEDVVGTQREELKKELTSGHFKEIVDKSLENAAEDGIGKIMAEVYKRLEGVP